MARLNQCTVRTMGNPSRRCILNEGHICGHVWEALKQPEPEQPEHAKAWAEFQLMVAVSNLRDVAPDHYLVRLIETALSPQRDLFNEQDHGIRPQAG